MVQRFTFSIHAVSKFSHHISIQAVLKRRKGLIKTKYATVFNYISQ